MSSLRYLPATIGTLVKLREQLQLVRRGKEILEMRRDQLIREIYQLLSEIRERERLEKEFLRIYDKVKELYMVMNADNIRSYARVVRRPELRLLYESLMGVKVPRVDILSEPDFSQVTDLAVHALAEELWKLLYRLIEITRKEAAVENLSKELAYINRVVNSLEKNIIPQLNESIHYVEEKVQEESLSEFVRIKKVRDVVQRRRG
ncbi:MAG: V-type ATP synthase subunit D [Thermoprotei archaeon]|nr:V-type ATP synthase subunit D [Thermoprotei archaeon]